MNSVATKAVLIAIVLFGVALLPQGDEALGADSSKGSIQSELPRDSSVRQPGRVAIASAFSIRKQDGVDWLVNPVGMRFFSRGVCCVDRGIRREDYDPNKPGYAAWQHYADSNQWADATLTRLKSWGFNTIGGWSDFRTLVQCTEPQVVFTPVLHVGSYAGAPWVDMWDPKTIERMEQVARDQIQVVRDDPRLLGYYSDNEVGWWNATLFQMALEQPPTSGQRQRLLELLRQTYHSDWSELLKDFDPEGARDFEELDQRGKLYLRGGSNGMRTMRKFLGLMAERYYSLVHEIIRKYDPRGLVLGDRYQSFYYPEVARASGRNVDAASGNLNAGWNDGSFARFYLETLHELTGKPVFVSEFYMVARESRSGNENTPGFPVVDTQRERVAGFRRTLEMLLRTPYVVGADWFQYFDEPTHGRADGENYSFGLVDIHNRPYELLVMAARALDCEALKSATYLARPDASQGVPPAPRDPFAEFAPTLALKAWDRERGYVKPISDYPMADLYVCWNAKAIYLGLYAQDVVEQECYRDKKVPDSDRAEWVVQTGEAGRAIRARIGGGAKQVISDLDVRVIHLSGVQLNTRCIAAMELPASLFGRTRFNSGDQIEFSSSFLSHCGGYQVKWRGKFNLQSPR